VALYSYRGKVENLFHLDKEKSTFKMLIDDIPERLVIDEDYDLARRLSTSEFPPVVERLIGDQSQSSSCPTLEGRFMMRSSMPFRREARE